jgi:hypothetical protein
MKAARASTPVQQGQKACDFTHFLGLSPPEKRKKSHARKKDYLSLPPVRWRTDS